MSSARIYTTGCGQYARYVLAFTVWTRGREGKPHLLLERESLLHRQAVRLRNDRHYVYNLA